MTDEHVDIEPEDIWQLYESHTINIKDHTSWGCFVNTYIPMQNWQGSFLWFDTWTDLRAFLIQYLPALNPSPDASPERIRDEVTRLLSDASTPTDRMESLRKDIDAALGRSLCLEWWGTFGSLCEDSHEVATSARSWFRTYDNIVEGTADANAANAARPLTEDELDSFKEVLPEYGI